ncbi:MAG TPA: hypothetical protein VHC49_21755, partial [Mycobacteriales bacterium]|nr:hypothetical protein [Mycobacteriales bacterium]
MSSPDVPNWLLRLTRELADRPAQGTVPDQGTVPAGRAAAVLLLFGDGPDLLLIERSRQLRAHAG